MEEIGFDASRKLVEGYKMTESVPPRTGKNSSQAGDPSSFGHTEALVCTAVERCSSAPLQLTLGQTTLYTKQNPERKTANEDSCAIIPVGPDAVVLVVADGAGGLPAGGQASGLAVEALKDRLTQFANLKGFDSGGSLRGVILDAIEAAHSAIGALGVGAGTTLAVAEISVSRHDPTNEQTSRVSSAASSVKKSRAQPNHHHRLRTYHVGDSQIMVVGGRGLIKLLTTSHSPVGYALEAGLISEAEAIKHDERHLVSNLLGYSEMHIDIGTEVSLAPRDTLLMASDGLFDNLLQSEISAMMRQSKLQRATESLMNLASQRMEQPVKGAPSKVDDLTAILFRKS